MRWLYAWLLRAHPRAFRTRFTDEMLSVYDDAARAGETWPLVVSAAASLCRQWMRRPFAKSTSHSVPPEVAEALQHHSRYWALERRFAVQLVVLFAVAAVADPSVWPSVGLPFLALGRLVWIERSRRRDDRIYMQRLFTKRWDVRFAAERRLQRSRGAARSLIPAVGVWVALLVLKVWSDRGVGGSHWQLDLAMVMMLILGAWHHHRVVAVEMRELSAIDAVPRDGARGPLGLDA